MFERRIEYLTHGCICDGQFGTSEVVRTNFVRIVDKGDGIVGENKVLWHEDIHSPEVSPFAKCFESFKTSIFLQCFKKDFFKK